jgi:siroheme synthase-like protein
MPNGLPVVLQLTDIPCLVLGTNAEADSKVAMLERAGAVVTRYEAYRPGCLDGFTLAIAALDDRSLNPAIAKEAAQLGVLLNCVDDPANCRFILASVAEQGQLQVAISTGGACPALAVRLREKLERDLGPEYAAFLELAGGLREELAARVPDFQRRRTLWYEIVDSPALGLLAADQPAAASRAIEQLIQQAVKDSPHAPRH